MNNTATSNESAVSRQGLWMRLIEAGIRAPSGDNCQPWRFRLDGDRTLAIDIVRERAKSFFDFHYRATFLSVGAVVENMRLQAAGEGYAMVVGYPGGTLPGQAAATVEVQRQAGPAIPEPRLRALRQRTVNRRPYLPLRRPSAEQLAALTADSVADTKVSVYDQRKQIRAWARIIYLADRIRYSHPRIHQEMFGKILLTPEEVETKRMGLEYDRLGIGPGATGILRLLKPWQRMRKLSRFGVDGMLSNQSRLLVASSGAVVLVTIPDNTPQHWMQAGEQVERLWNGARELGLSVHPMAVAPYLLQRYEEEGMTGFEADHEVLLKQIKEAMNGFLEGRVGAMVFRLGYGVNMGGASVRLPVETFVDRDSMG